MWRRGGCAAVLAAALTSGLLSACTEDDQEPTQPESGPPPWVTQTREPTTDTQPLVLAVNARRPPLAVTERQARRVLRGAVTDWRQLGQPAGPLRITDRRHRLRHLPMDTVAVVPADAVGPAVRVATVAAIDPLREPAAYPIQVRGQAPGAVTTLTVVGDIMLGRGVAGSPALWSMSDRLASADITVGNLESTLAELGPPRQDPVTDSFSASPGVRADLREAGFDALSLANNHTGDFGDASLVRTVQLLSAGACPPSARAVT